MFNFTTASMNHPKIWLTIGVLLMVFLSAKNADTQPFNSETVIQVIFPQDANNEYSICSASPYDYVPCLLNLSFANDPDAGAIAVDIWRRFGWLSGIILPHEMDGGWRGLIQLEPERPIHNERKHLQWIYESGQDLNLVLESLQDLSKTKINFRIRDIAFKFMRSVNRTTPNAVAVSPWNVNYNLAGSLLKSHKGVFELVAHEVFHLNDIRPEGWWSDQALTTIYKKIVALCHPERKAAASECLKPYAPNHMKVRNSTYYAFIETSSPTEYAAELNVRYFSEQLEMINHGRLKGPAFKCLTSENALAWKKLKTEFFNGVDLTPPCH